MKYISMIITFVLNYSSKRMSSISSRYEQSDEIESVEHFRAIKYDSIQNDMKLAEKSSQVTKMRLT